ncbi:phenylalanine--tRNA ligase subunit beta [Thiohalomonas denitrificans]|uniref:Phenylalanine--tRNA ligase beta subunit n=1 Tax=Thiohalomonas denitrificans TaxID=415747 RepID=A0A1G5PJC0_9GAMM|nr:phenylalanine--tRNA ligase subunit beta [Thiohalomonas denitrificans]SCZ49149.1 phenylalanyl-tRNA synthetase beta subunit [Thiohalomonas denitrificans]
MRFSEKWLREWVDPRVSTRELADQLTMAGLEVDAIDPVAPAFEGVVVGHVIEVETHPDADKLRVCKVDVGEGEPLDIVCGASNVYKGMHAPTAVVGARLPGDFKIKKAKLRGVPSRGMLCSAKELGLAEAAEGLMELPADAPVGTNFREYLDLDDVCIELGLTPNRADCLSIIGIAREVGALNQLDVNETRTEGVGSVIEDAFPVEVDAPVDCPRYVGRVIRGINAATETPVWMRERLRRSGIRSLGPVVDVTNYVLLELGQPMHGFDLNRLQDGIWVRKAKEGETLALLTGEQITLDSVDLVIADRSGPLALAGIMGGEASGVSEQTRDIFLESAFFEPTRIAGRARGYGLHTDSSHRFERGVDAYLQQRAIERATELLLGITGGKPGPIVEVVSEEYLPARTPVALRHQRITRVLGSEIPVEQVQDVLERLAMEATSIDDGWMVTPPSFRFDIGIEEDLIEEVARVVGYNNLAGCVPNAPLVMRTEPEAEVPLTHLRRLLVDRGYQEAITYSFVEPRVQQALDPEAEGIPLANPISADLSVMRTTLWSGLVPALVRNLNRQQGRVRLFETGLRFRRSEEETCQEPMLAGIVAGSVFPEQWGTVNRAVDFFDIKGDVEELLQMAGRAADVVFEAAEHPALHPGQSALIRLDGEPIGWIGALHPSVETSLDLSARAFVFEVRLDAVTKGRLPQFHELSRFPAIRRDIAVVVERDMPAAKVVECARAAAPEILRELKFFDVYEGEHIDSSRKSLALRLTLQSRSRTLTDEEVDAVIDGIVTTLGNQLGASLRE